MMSLFKHIVLEGNYSRSDILLFLVLGILAGCRSLWPGGLRHELSSLAQTLRSWVRNPL
jgi:hypothetical protein